VNENLRPRVPDEFRESQLVPLMTDCWQGDADQRPSFEVIVKRLERMFEDELRTHQLDQDTVGASHGGGGSSNKDDLNDDDDSPSSAAGGGGAPGNAPPSSQHASPAK